MCVFWQYFINFCSLSCIDSNIPVNTRAKFCIQHCLGDNDTQMYTCLGLYRFPDSQADITHFGGRKNKVSLKKITLLF